MRNQITLMWLVAFATAAPAVVAAQPAAAGPSIVQDSATSAPPALAARFELTSRALARGGASRSIWHLLRADNRVEAFTLGAPSSEVWERDSAGEISLKRVFDADRRVVEYTSADLRAGERLRPWAAIASVIDPRLLSTLRRAGTRATEFGAAQVYRRANSDGSLEVWWLPDRQLPARVLHSHERERLDLRLRELRDQPARHWNAPSTASRDDYLAIDSIDLGDMYYDPFVHKVEWIDSQARPFGITGHHH